MNGKHLLRFMRDKYKKESQTVVKKDRATGELITLEQVNHTTSDTAIYITL